MRKGFLSSSGLSGRTSGATENRSKNSTMNQLTNPNDPSSENMILSSNVVSDVLSGNNNAVSASQVSDVPKSRTKSSDFKSKGSLRIHRELSRSGKSDKSADSSQNQIQIKSTIASSNQVASSSNTSTSSNVSNTASNVNSNVATIPSSNVADDSRPSNKTGMRKGFLVCQTAKSSSMKSDAADIPDSTRNGLIEPADAPASKRNANDASGKTTNQPGNTTIEPGNTTTEPGNTTNEPGHTSQETANATTIPSSNASANTNVMSSTNVRAFSGGHGIAFRLGGLGNTIVSGTVSPEAPGNSSTMTSVKPTSASRNPMPSANAAPAIVSSNAMPAANENSGATASSANSTSATSVAIGNPASASSGSNASAISANSVSANGAAAATGHAVPPVNATPSSSGPTINVPETLSRSPSIASSTSTEDDVHTREFIAHHERVKTVAMRNQEQARVLHEEHFRLRQQVIYPLIGDIDYLTSLLDTNKQNYTELLDEKEELKKQHTELLDEKEKLKKGLSEVLMKSEVLTNGHDELNKRKDALEKYLSEQDRNYRNELAKANDVIDALKEKIHTLESKLRDAEKNGSPAKYGPQFANHLPSSIADILPFEGTETVMPSSIAETANHGITSPETLETAGRETVFQTRERGKDNASVATPETANGINTNAGTGDMETAAGFTNAETRVTETVAALRRQRFDILHSDLESDRKTNVDLQKHLDEVLVAHNSSIQSNIALQEKNVALQKELEASRKELETSKKKLEEDSNKADSKVNKSCKELEGKGKGFLEALILQGMKGKGNSNGKGDDSIPFDASFEVVLSKGSKGFIDECITKGFDKGELKAFMAEGFKKGFIIGKGKGRAIACEGCRKKGFEEGKDQICENCRQKGFNEGLAKGRKLICTPCEERGFESGKDSGFEIGIAKGFHDGRSKGEEKGKERGYSKGFDAGKEKGYSKGFDVGCERGLGKGFIRSMISSSE